ncbi:hypothetical protein BJ322DRAFT_826933 [Thelephora terrestris]|uniref:Uncharacterized protein n=1 Tax=Thelephora terrestris TaxID=56493 RepID=A0A9P6L6F4_9AGAM|nr:hypothetical protein BJ322DRAFT_826933 [Thelephora terrestris]
MSRVMYPPQVMESTYGNMTGNLRHGCERLTPANLQLDCAAPHDWSGTVDARQIQTDANWRSINPSQVHGTRTLLTKYASSSSGGPHKYRTMSRRDAPAPFLPGGDGLEPNPFIMTGYTPPKIGESGGTPDPVEHTEPRDIRSPSHSEIGGAGESIAKPSHHTVGVRGFRKAEETIDAEMDMPSRKRVRRSSPGAAPVSFWV